MRPPIHPCQRVADAASDSPYDSPVALSHTHTQSQHPATIQNRHSRTLTTSTYNPATAGWHPVTHSHVQPVRQTQPTRQPAATRQQPIDRQPAATRLPPLPDPPTPSRTRASPLLHGSEGEPSPRHFSLSLTRIQHDRRTGRSPGRRSPDARGNPHPTGTPRLADPNNSIPRDWRSFVHPKSARSRPSRARGKTECVHFRCTSTAPSSSHALAIAAHSFREAQSASRSVKKESQCLTF